MRKTVTAAALIAAAIGLAPLAPVASAEPLVPPAPPFTDPPPTFKPMAPVPNVNQGTGDPAHNICVLTGHNC